MPVLRSLHRLVRPDRSRPQALPGAGAGGPEVAWHALDSSAVLQALETTVEGLSSREAAARLAAAGPNRLPAGRQQSLAERLLLQFHNLLIYVLLGAAALAFALGHLVDGGVILGVVVINAAIGFVQEGRAERALEALKGMIDPKASVIREGRRATIPADQVVPGDIVLIEAGDRVPADLRLIRARNLKTDEAILTGESVALEKAVAAVPREAPLGDRHCMAYSGTFVAAGQGSGVVVATGARSELGRISAMISAVESLETPLIRQMNGFARQLTQVILGIAVLSFLFAYLARDYPPAEAFMVVVGLVVAAIPEGLPAIMTITLAIGVQRMAARNAIIRRLPAVETLGSVSVICSDKTGTLTRNEMMAQWVVAGGESFEVTGSGYAPEGGFRLAGREVEPARHPVLMELVRTGLLCNDAEIRPSDAGWTVDGDPMEGALVSLAVKAGLDADRSRRQLPQIDVIPFDSQHRFMASLHRSPKGHGIVLIKGAPEKILGMCATERHPAGDRPLDVAGWERTAAGLAARGLRLLAFAAKPAPAEQQTLALGDIDADAVLLGFVGFIDPPREEAMAAIRDCRRAGIRVAMITGDHAVTAREIARQLGLADDPVTLTGPQLDALSDQELTQAVRHTAVFARASPEHKLRLVQALQANGHTVAMTGDGVNDAPALKRADVGIAMGRKGTEAAKEAAEMVLADDNFASIVAAVREGRTVYDNLMKVISWTLPTNGGESLTIMAAIALGLALPISPVQILWINMITAVGLGLTLAFEPTEPGTMSRPPRPPAAPILGRELAWPIVFVSVLFVTAAFGLYFWAEVRQLPVETARTIVVNAIVVMEIFYLFAVRYMHGTSLTWRGVLGTPAVLTGVGVVVVAQLLFTYLPVMQAIFATRPLGLAEGAAVIGVGVALLLIVEAERKLRALLGARIRPSGR